MKIGFTGTQKGMTEAQKRSFLEFLNTVDVDEFHHGDCIGADYDAHNLVMGLKKSRDGIVIHPPKNESKRAFCTGERSLEPDEYLVRNRNIVDGVDLLIATPKEYVMEVRSGTWYTVRYASKKRKRIVIVYPDGTVEE